MPIKDRLFPSQVKQEKVFFLIRKHWFVYVIFGLLFVLMIVPVIVVMIYWSLNFQDISTLNGNIIIAGIAAYLLFMIGVQLFGFVDFYLDVVIITDRRIIDIDQDGLFKRRISELHLRQVQDVEAKVVGIAATLFHFGDVFIQTAGEHENFIFRSIPHPYTVAKQIANLHEQQYQHDLGAQVEKQGEMLTKNLSVSDLESQAKGILRSQSFTKRIVNPGIFLAPGLKKIDDLGEEDGFILRSENEVSSKKAIDSTIDILDDKVQTETVASKTKRITKRKRTKKKVRTSKAARTNQSKKIADSVEEGELKEGQEVDIND